MDRRTGGAVVGHASAGGTGCAPGGGDAAVARRAGGEDWTEGEAESVMIEGIEGIDGIVGLLIEQGGD
jgi:hypothetical protein